MGPIAFGESHCRYSIYVLYLLHQIKTVQLIRYDVKSPKHKGPLQQTENHIE